MRPSLAAIRACGSRPAKEAALKLLELTAGGVMAYHDSPLGFRHGPNAHYDDDIVTELAAELGTDRVVVLEVGDPAPPPGAKSVRTWRANGLDDVEDVLVAVVYAVFAQLFALRYSVRAGLQPDNPFPSGEVNRVVRGVTVHPYPA